MHTNEVQPRTKLRKTVDVLLTLLMAWIAFRGDF
jgi:hypothetical protein